LGQKLKLAKKLGIEAKMINLKPQKTEDVLSVIRELNADPAIHGLIVQRPFPQHIDTESIIQSVSNYKDIDGFREDSLYEVPVWLAVKYFITHAAKLLDIKDFNFWLSNQSILIVGRGQTAGNPVIKALRKMQIEPQIIHSKTQDTDALYKDADVIIFATGRFITVPFHLLKPTSILIGIGLHKNNGQLMGDFDEFEARRSSLYYTPSPGGVGPLNLFFLFQNLIKAAEKSASSH